LCCVLVFSVISMSPPAADIPGIFCSAASIAGVSRGCG